MTVYFKDKNRFGQTITLPHVGEVKISETGTFEVKDKVAAEALCDDLPVICTLEKGAQHTAVASQVNDDSAEAWAGKFKTMKMTELQAFVGEFPEEFRAQFEGLQKLPLIKALSDFMASPSAAELLKSDENQNEENGGDEGGDGNENNTDGNNDSKE